MTISVTCRCVPTGIPKFQYGGDSVTAICLHGNGIEYATNVLIHMDSLAILQTASTWWNRLFRYLSESSLQRLEQGWVFIYVPFNMFNMSKLTCWCMDCDMWVTEWCEQVARARPAVPLGLWSITSSLRGNLYVPRLHKFIKWFADNDVAHRN